MQDRIHAAGDISSDLILFEEIVHRSLKTEYLAYNVPLTLPKCMTCKLRCPGYETCKEEEILWMWENYRKRESEKSRHKLFTPYTERCVEQYLSGELEEAFQMQHAMGANLAPLTARAHFLNRRLNLKTIEVYPKLSLWRIGRALNIQKSYLRFHKHQIGGLEMRQAIIKELVNHKTAFIYDQDIRLMVDNSHAFDAFICALTAVLKFTGQCEKRPRNFPADEGWIEIPKEVIVW
ncbi:MAG: hypothetical protein A2Z20_09565 [Bdellovibrionales bacterium RBG_16_40_8]|nr:MAG: hypothetical protein A2Z20_09565 [Bdellovibrionales bacterium RBG_16_40_8]